MYNAFGKKSAQKKLFVTCLFVQNGFQRIVITHFTCFNVLNTSRSSFNKWLNFLRFYNVDQKTINQLIKKREIKITIKHQTLFSSLVFN